MSALAGLLIVEFVCPKCKGRGWGTLGTVGRCNTRPCGFEWNRRDDFRVFVRKDTGQAFASPEELARVMGLPTYAVLLATRRPTLAELIYGLLVEVMARPPTLGVVETWSHEELRAALRWASNELKPERELVLDDETPEGRLVIVATRKVMARPAFIEEGAATA